MDPILDETSLEPCQFMAPGVRIRILANAIRALDALGVPRVLLSVRDAADRDLSQGRGLRAWCFDRDTDRDAGRFVANRLGKQPFIDGPDGLFAAIEGQRAIEARVVGCIVLGLGLAALEDGVALALGNERRSARGAPILVELTYLDGFDETSEVVAVECLVSEVDVAARTDFIVERVDQSIVSGQRLIERAPEVFPLLRFGPQASDQIAALTGTEPIFKQLLRHLRALDRGARNWLPATSYTPASALPWSVESSATLGHGKFGPLRDFPVPDGFSAERWTLHTKLAAGKRLYFRALRTATDSLVLIGYFGEHLPTVKFPG